MTEKSIDEYRKHLLDESLGVYVECVRTGSKPVASLQLRVEDVAQAKDFVEKERLDWWVSVGEEWAAFYIFREPIMCEVIKYMNDLPESVPFVVGQWMAGSMYGYSQEDIAAYIEHQWPEWVEDAG